MFNLAGKKIGRIYCNLFASKNPSAHVRCHAGNHANCERWQIIEDIPGENKSHRMAEWLVRASEFPDSKAHLGQWNNIVLSEPS